jgi:hypothetical protein
MKTLSVLFMLALFVLPMVASASGPGAQCSPFSYDSMGEKLYFLGANDTPDTLWFCKTVPPLGAGSDHAQWVPWQKLVGVDPSGTVRKVSVPTAGLFVECTDDFAWNAVFNGGAIAGISHVDTVMTEAVSILKGDNYEVAMDFPCYTFIAGAVDTLYIMGVDTGDSVRVYSLYSKPGWMK